MERAHYISTGNDLFNIFMPYPLSPSYFISVLHFSCITFSSLSTWNKRISAMLRTTLFKRFHQLKGDEIGAQGKDEKCDNVLVRKPIGRRTLEIPGRRWEDNIKMDLDEEE
jgi:hypothetical protein